MFGAGGESSDSSACPARWSAEQFRQPLVVRSKILLEHPPGLLNHRLARTGITPQEGRLEGPQAEELDEPPVLLRGAAAILRAVDHLDLRPRAQAECP